jgi:hypothetical protein
MTIFKKICSVDDERKRNERMNEHVPFVELCWQGRTCPSAILSTINPTWTDLKLNQSLHGYKPANNHLGHCTVGRGYRTKSGILCLIFSLLFIVQYTDWASPSPTQRAPESHSYRRKDSLGRGSVHYRKSTFRGQHNAPSRSSKCAKQIDTPTPRWGHYVSPHFELGIQGHC